MWAPAAPVGLTDEQRRVLEGWVRAPSTPQGLVLKARIILMASEGIANHAIAKTLGTSRPTVQLWRQRFEKGGLKALTKIEKGRGPKRVILPEKVAAIVEATLHSRPPNATHWSCRTMAKAMGVSPDTVNRIWRAHELQPHRVTTFKLSQDPRFVEKLSDVIGLYLNPPEHALVLCVDEKSQIQALDRSQPMLPMRPGQVARRSHDYKRHGTTSLFAALDVATGQVIGKCYGRHRATEFRKFLDEIEANVPKGLEVHLVWDNYATHKTPLIRNWLAKRPRWHVHPTPTSASWLNQVERFFALITERKIRRGIYRSVAALRADIACFIERHNLDPKPFRWTKSADDILRSIERFCLYNAPANA